MPSPHIVVLRGGSSGEGGITLRCSASLRSACAPRDLGFTRTDSRADQLRALESRRGSVRTLRQCSSQCACRPARSLRFESLPVAACAASRELDSFRLYFCGEGGIRTLGTVARTLDWGCPAPSSARPAACALPASPKFRARPRRPARGMGEAVAGCARHAAGDGGSNARC